MHAHDFAIIISAIDRSPYNRGLSGAEWLAIAGNQPFAFENGDVILFEDTGDRIFHVHYLFDKARGREALKQARAAFKVMFEKHKARALAGLTPLDNRAARMFNRLVGGKSIGIVETPFGPCEKFVMTRQMWKAN